MKSETLVKQISRVLTQEYVNPFDGSLDDKNLYKLSSGVPIDDELAEGILSVKVKGENLFNAFYEHRIKSTVEKINAPIKRQTLTLFKSAGKTISIKFNNKENIVAINRNISGTLLTHSAKTGRTMDFASALKYPLGPVPLCFAHPDGTRRTTKKSQLMEVTLASYSGNTDSGQFSLDKSTVAAYLIDLMAMVRAFPGLYDTYHDLAMQLFKTLPVGYKRIDIIADTYQPGSLKDPERLKRGSSAEIIVQSAQSKVLRNFSDFLKNGENKTRLIKLIVNKDHVLDMLQCQQILFSMHGTCYRIFPSSVQVVEELSSNQEEADTKLLLHANHVLNNNSEEMILIRSPSGDVDVNIMFISLFQQNSDRIYLDYATRKSKKVVQLSLFQMQDDLRSALIGFHSFTGNDYVSSIFRKSKKMCRKLVEKSKMFAILFKMLGEEWDLPDITFQQLEEYMCKLFGKSSTNIDEVRHIMFRDFYEKRNKIQDLSLLPPCSQSLKLHCKRSNFVARLPNLCFDTNPEIPDASCHGWDSDGTINWIETAFPSDVEEILTNDDDDVDGDEMLCEFESDDSDDGHHSDKNE